MYSSLASSNSPLVYYFTIALIVLIPIIMFIIGLVSVRKEDPNSKRAGYAMLKLAGLLTAVLAALIVFFYFNGALTAPTGSLLAF